jgi:hypothetical protein
MEGEVVELAGYEDCGRSDGGEECHRFGGVVAGSIFKETAEKQFVEENESRGQAGESEGAPGENGEEPRLGSAQIVASVDVGQGSQVGRQVV